MSRYDEFFNEMMKDPEVKREFDALEPEFQAGVPAHQRNDQGQT